MPGPVTFNIAYSVSADAVSRTLEYRFLNPSNVFSAWTQNIATGVNTPVNTQNGTVLNFNINPAIGDGNQFYYNTVYQFRVQTICSDGTIEYSDPTTNLYETNCPTVRFIRNRTYGDGGYSFTIILNDSAGNVPMNPAAYSIVSYQFEIYSVVGVVRTLEGTFTASALPPPAGDIIPGSPNYSFQVFDNDLINGIQSGGTYELDYSFVLRTGPSTTITVDCNTLQITLPECTTYKIYTNERWNLEYTDCDGIPWEVSNVDGQPNPPSSGVNYFFICSQTEPKGFACVNFVLSPPALINPGGGQPIPITNPVLPGSWPVNDLLYGAVVEIFDVNNCLDCYNGNVVVLSQNAPTPCYPDGAIVSIPNGCQIV